MVDFYKDLSMDEIAATYTLIKFLKRLRVIGNLECRTIQTSLMDVDALGRYDVAEFKDDCYGIEKMSYSPSRGGQDVEELLETIFGRTGKRYRGIP